MGFLHHPALDELTLLSGITAVYHLGRLGDERFYDFELPLDARRIYQLDAEWLGNHRQCRERPPFPAVGIVGRFLEHT